MAVDIPWLVSGGLAYLLATAVVLFYTGLAVRRLFKLRRTASASDHFADLLFPVESNADPALTLPSQRSPRAHSRSWQWGCAGIGYIAIVALFLLPVLLAWYSGEVQTPYLAVGGLLPWSDSSGWLHGLYYLLNEGDLTDWTVRRPLHLMYLASLTLVSGLELHGMLLLRTMMLATACTFLARELQQSFGTASALVALAMLVGFAATFSPTTMSEVSGLTFGAAAMALLWRGLRREQIGCYALGASLMALALSVRTGPVFVLASIVLWPLVWQGTSIRRRLRWTLAAAAAVFAGAALAWLWTSILYSGDNMPGANFAFVLYGLAHGGLSWQVFFEHVDASGLSQGAQSELAYRAAFAQIKAHPALLLEGMWSFTQKYLKYHLIYAPVPFHSRIVWLFWIGAAVCVWRWRQPEARFLLLVMFGVAATAPIIFWSADAYRAYIVTAPIDATLVAAAVGMLVALARGEPRPFTHRPTHRPTYRPTYQAGLIERRLLPGFGALLIASTTLLPAIALSIGGPRPVSPPICPATMVPLVVELGADTVHLKIVADALPRSIFGAQIRLADFRAGVERGNTAIADELLKLPPDSVVTHAYNLLAPRLHTVWAVFKPGQIQEHGVYAVCGVEKRVTRGNYAHTLIFAQTAHRQVSDE